MQLVFDMQSYWLAGTGSDAGAYADNLANKDHHGLPFLPAKTQKGQIREAFKLAEDNGWFTDFTQQFDSKLTQILFGVESRDGRNGQGVLQFCNAELSDNEKGFFLQGDSTEKKQRINCLFTLLHSTAIDELGKAKPYSLRSYEVAVPMTLHGKLDASTQHLEPAVRQAVTQHLPTWLEQVLPLVTHIGAKKQRGLGEVNIRLVQTQGE
ncbi:RAMP superfamily CRISPR-associated protein [Vibrio mexicanus]|uniref:RAMP superfamily CRISPR-associated protein n=1 Tax=Vibrio mexicanus TaxID=1004326 RepID=UPI00063CF9DF|nr:RAMP superfamily CRISPR-associated protein [Vibrio mexicanus]